MLALVLVVLLVVALSGGGGGGRGLHLSGENRAALRNAQPLGVGLDRLLLGAPLPSAAEQQSALSRLLATGLPVFCAGPQHRYVALTFDDGPGPRTAQVLRILGAAGQRATFFILGRQLADYPDLPAVEARAGAVGDHTFSHGDLTRLDPVTRTAELSQTRSLLERLTDRPVTLFRPPYGVRNPGVDAVSQQLNLLQVTWNVDTQDAEGARAADIVSLAKAGMRPGAIILMHENKPETLVALPRILRALQRRGFHSVTVPELLALNPPSDQQLRAGFQGCVSAERPSRAFSPTGAA